MKYSDLINFNPIESVVTLTDANDKQKASEFVKSYVMSDCQTAHCGRCEQHFIVGAFTSPTVRFGR